VLEVACVELAADAAVELTEAGVLAPALPEEAAVIGSAD
jgi:hypothetical protein